MRPSIDNDIDLLEDMGFKDPYFLCLRLLNLVRNKKKSKLRKGCHFKFLIEQDNQIIDQTPVIEDSFWIMKTHSISLNKESLNFIVPDPNNSNSQFQMKMYRTSQNSVQQLATLQINSLTYIQLFLEDNKKIFNQTIALSSEYSLQYQIFIEKTKIQLDNLLISSQNDSINYAFKKKESEFIEIDNQKVQILRKDTFPPQFQILRKSLQVNTKKLKQIKQKKAKNQLQKSRSFNKSKSSFLTQIGGMIMQGLTPKKQQQKQNIQIQEDQKSISLCPPLIGPHKYNRPQNKFYYNRLNIERQKQLQRLRKQEAKNTSSSLVKQQNFSGFIIGRSLKFVIILMLILMIIYLVINPFKKVKTFKWIKNISSFKF